MQAIEQESFTDPWPPHDFTEAMEWPVVFLVAAIDSRVIGYVIAQPVADEGEILNVAVDGAFRGRGVARSLIRHTLAHLARIGVESVFLEVRESNRAARTLYERLGFSEVGRRRGYYRKPREDAVLLRTVMPRGDHPVS